MSTEFLWRDPTTPTRGPKPALTLDQIVDTAIALADAEGLAAVSMHRVATDLGFTKMSLYRYLPGKPDLVALMMDRAMGGPPTMDTQDWRAGLTGWAHHLLAGFVQHPWALEASVGPRPIGPNELGWMESAAAVLATTGLTGGEQLDTMAVLSGHVRMIAQQAVLSDQPEAQLHTAIVALLQNREDSFPALAATLRSAQVENRQDDAFTFGLDRILDGIEALIRRRTPRRRSRSA